MVKIFTVNKKIYVILIVFVCISVWTISRHLDDTASYQSTPLVYRRSGGYYQKEEFDPNLPILRQKIRKIIRSSDPNNYSLETAQNRNNSNRFDFLNATYILTHGISGQLSVYRWYDFCSIYTNQLKSIPGFPFNPSVKLTTNSLEAVFSANNFGQRIFGYLLAPSTGFYEFCISSTAGLEFWLSYDPDPYHSFLIASICDSQSDCPARSREYKLTSTRCSEPISLIIDKPYYMEFLHVALIEVKWKIPGSTVYSTIPNDNFISLIGEDSISDRPRSPQPYPSHVLHALPPDPILERDSLFKFPKLMLSEFSDSIPNCDYLSEEIRNTYTNKFSVPYLSVYPNDNTEIMNEDDVSPGNILIPKREALFVVASFLKQVKQNFPELDLHKIVNIEKYQHQLPVARYLIEILVCPQGNISEIFLISETFFSTKTPAESFCQHRFLKRETLPFVHIIVGMKNLGKWARDLVENVERIYEDTRDERFSLVIVDFESEDIDMELLLRQSALRHWTLIQVEGSFLRSGGINLALDQIPSVDIFFTADLTLGIPSSMLDYIRKRTFQGYSAYAPVVTRHMCGHSFMHPLGYWEVMGYGLMGMYKSDWVRVGGMNSVDFQEKWGGEDWNCADKILERGINLNRIKERHLFHHYHSKFGLLKTKEFQ